jgi:hypothetical protein
MTGFKNFCFLAAAHAIKIETDSKTKRGSAHKGSSSPPVMSQSEVDLLFPKDDQQTSGFYSPSNPLATPRGQDIEGGHYNELNNDGETQPPNKNMKTALIAVGAVCCVGLGVGLGVGLTTDSSSGGSAQSRGFCPLTVTGTSSHMILEPDSALNECEYLEGGLFLSFDFEGDVDLDDYLPNLKYIAGDFVVNSNDDLVSVTKDWSIQAEPELIVEGDVIVQNNPNLKLFNVKTISEIGGDLEIFNNPALEVFGVPFISFIGGDLYVEANHALPVLDLEIRNPGDRFAWVPVGGDIKVMGNNNLDSIKLPSFDTLGGDLVIRDNTNLESVRIPEILEFPGRIELENNDRLAYVRLASGLPFRAVGGDVSIVDNGRDYNNETAVSGFQLGYISTIGGKLDVRDNHWESMDLDLLHLSTIDGTLRINDDAGIKISGLEMLTNVGGDFTLQGVTTSPILDLANMQHVGGGFTVQGLPEVELLNVGNLKSVGESRNVLIRNNLRLAYLDFRELETVNDVWVTTNFQEPTFLANGAAFFNKLAPSGNIRFTNNALLADGIHFTDVAPTLSDYKGDINMENNGPTGETPCQVIFGEEQIPSCNFEHKGTSD